MDEDDDTRDYGAEVDFYASLNPSYEPRNGPFTLQAALWELRRLIDEGLSEEAFGEKLYAEFVEKVAELGATSLRWIRTDRSQVPAPNPSKTRAWADAALEQSRGAWALEIGETTWAELDS